MIYWSKSRLTAASGPPALANFPTFAYPSHLERLRHRAMEKTLFHLCVPAAPQEQMYDKHLAKQSPLSEHLANPAGCVWSGGAWHAKIPWQMRIQEKNHWGWGCKSSCMAGALQTFDLCKGLLATLSLVDEIKIEAKHFQRVDSCCAANFLVVCHDNIHILDV